MTQSYSAAPQPNFTAFWAHIKSDSSLSYLQTSLPKARPLLCFYLLWTCKLSSAKQCNGCQPVAMPEFSLCSASIIVPKPWSFPESAATTPIFDHLATYNYQRCVNQVYVHCFYTCNRWYGKVARPIFFLKLESVYIPKWFIKKFESFHH